MSPNCIFRIQGLNVSQFRHQTETLTPGSLVFDLVLEAIERASLRPEEALINECDLEVGRVNLSSLACFSTHFNCISLRTSSSDKLMILGARSLGLVNA